MNKKVVVLGGGTGLSTLLRGLKQFPVDITAVVSVSDDGSSTGRLREEFNIPAIGDLRNVMVSLSEVEPILEQLLQYRFKTNSDLNGHPVGNLLLAAMLDVTGDMVGAVSAFAKILNIKGKILPFTEEQTTLMAETSDGEILEGESKITKAGKVIKTIYYKETPKVVPEVIDAILNSDLIVFSTGSLYTSILPNIICDEMTEAIKKSKAKKMYICNIMTEHGETDNFKVSDYVKILNKYVGTDFLDAVVVNSKYIDVDIQDRYKRLEKSEPVIVDEHELKKLNIEVIADNLVHINDKNQVRHNSMKTAFLIFSYLIRGE
ncbi:MAG: YvcK family protein [Bacilli bacterium]|nr:YvcK family protein [Bacilli bacterium]